MQKSLGNLIDLPMQEEKKTIVVIRRAISATLNTLTKLQNSRSTERFWKVGDHSSCEFMHNLIWWENTYIPSQKDIFIPLSLKFLICSLIWDRVLFIVEVKYKSFFTLKKLYHKHSFTVNPFLYIPIFSS